MTEKDLNESKSSDKIRNLNKSEKTKFKAMKLQPEPSKYGIHYRIQIPKEITDDFPPETKFWIGHAPGTTNVQLFPSGIGMPNPIDNTLERPKKLKQENFVTRAGTSFT